jgi:hypothetical protein
MIAASWGSRFIGRLAETGAASIVDDFGAPLSLVGD